MLGVAVCACVRRLRSRLRVSLRLRAAFAIATACDFALRSSTALSSLRAYGVRACPGDLPFALGAWSLPGLAFTVRWAGSALLLRRGWTLKRAGPY